MRTKSLNIYIYRSAITNERNGGNERKAQRGVKEEERERKSEKEEREKREKQNLLYNIVANK